MAPAASGGGLTMAKYIDREALVEWLKRIPLNIPELPKGDNDAESVD